MTTTAADTATTDAKKTTDTVSGTLHQF